MGILTVKHLALGTQPITLRHQIVNLLSSLQHTLNRLVQHDLRLVQLLLDLHDAIRLLRVLVLHDVILELWERERGVRVCPRGARVLSQELVDDLGKELMGYKRGVVVI
jgi:hypothetical protein